MNFNIDYLKSLIENKVEENLGLEYKSAMALDKQPLKMTEISKDVSAFANSDGGIIIYGIKEHNDKRHIPVEFDPVKRKDFPKEWLEQVINDKIRPRIENLKIYPIATSDDEAIYVVQIYKSDTAHQADDKRYYKRFNFQSVPMYDYEIRDILNRRKHPKLELNFEFENTHKTLMIYIRNVGSAFANYVNVRIRLPRKIPADNLPNMALNKDMVELFVNNTVREMIDPYAQVARYWPPRYEPILPQTRFLLQKIKLGVQAFEEKRSIEWDIFCDNTDPVSGSIKLSDILKS